MRILFSIVGLLVILGIVVFTAKQQLRALAPAPSHASRPSSSGSDNPSSSTPQQTIQEAQDEIQRAMEQGAARASEADR